MNRPWSQTYSERESNNLSQSVCRLSLINPCGEALHDDQEHDDTLEGEDGPRSLPYTPIVNPTMSTNNNGNYFFIAITK